MYTSEYQCWLERSHTLHTDMPARPQCKLLIAALADHGRWLDMHGLVSSSGLGVDVVDNPDFKNAPLLRLKARSYSEYSGLGFETYPDKGLRRRPSAQNFKPPSRRVHVLQCSIF